MSGTQVPTSAASALHVVKMSNALADACQVTTYGLEGESPDLAAYYGCEIKFRFRAFRSSSFPGGGYRFALKVAAATLNNKHDAFYGRHLHALWLTARYGVSFAYEAHDLPQSASKKWLLNKIANHPNCRAIVCISNELARDMAAVVGQERKIVVLPDAADTPPASGISQHSAWPGRPSVPQIGYVGHLYPGKGMEVVHALACSESQYDFHVIGGRSQDVAKWKSRGQPHNLFYHGFVRHSELPSYYAKLDVALLPIQASVWTANEKQEIGRWTSPLKAFEYMSHRIPVVASDVAALREIYEHEQSALLVKPGEIAEWSNAIARITRNPKLASTLSTNGWQQFKQHHTWHERANRVLGILR